MARKKIDYNLLEEIDPSKVPGLYETGKLNGLVYDIDFVKQLLSELSTPIFSIAASHLQDTGRGKLSTPYKFALKCDPEYGKCEPQRQGDCVSHSVRNSGMIDYCVDCITKGNKYNGRFCVEPHYGYRGSRSQGANCGRLASYVYKVGGYLVRGKYTSPDGKHTADLSQYNPSLSAAWGGPGTPDWITDLCKPHHAESIALITDTDELMDCIANGYGVTCCSSYGFSSSRNEYGLSNRRGSWSHALTFIGCNDKEDTPEYKKYGRTYLLQNSWGVWNSGPKTYDMPDGSWWITKDVAQGMLNHKGSWVISGVVGFPGRRLDYNLI